jgi:hypothetical protein
MRQKTAVIAVLTAGLAAATPARGDDCVHRAEREAALDAGGVRAVRIEAAAGSLRVEGRSGFTRVEARGTACAETQALLEKVGLHATRDGDTIVVKVETPDGSSWGWSQSSPRLDLAVSVPPTVALKVSDGSGEATIAHVGPLEVKDGSGELEISDVGGDVSVQDGSGEVRVSGVAGDVRLSDGSGSLVVREVKGSVVVEEDGSGEIDIANVAGSVTVERDGSGSIEVADVRGDFVVRRDGSGGIDHRGIAGAVRIPER